jgi:hypothetical protein
VCSLQYVEPLSAARTPLADFVNRLLDDPEGKFLIEVSF